MSIKFFPKTTIFFLLCCNIIKEKRKEFSNCESDYDPSQSNDFALVVFISILFSLVESYLWERL